MTVTEPCVSLTPGALSPDLRVNYAFGMVLGVDEFRQEQFHQQEKDSLLNRALHGYGIVSGLDVSVASVSGDVNDHDQDFVVTVGKGIGVDQWGREFAVRSPQCASVGSWMAGQERAQPGIIEGHSGGSGEVTVYVVAGYSTCLDNAIPVPVQTCSSGEPTTVASRVRDAWAIDFRLDPPPMPRFDADRRFQRLMQSVRIERSFEGVLPGEPDLFAAVRALATKTPTDFIDDGTNVGRPAFVIDPDQATETLDRAFRIWVDEVRPALEPDLISPAPTSEPAILLGAMTALVNRPLNLDGVRFSNVFMDGETVRKPYLLHTGLTQQLAETGSTGDRPDPIQAVTLSPALSSAGVLTITATFALDNGVQLTAPATVWANHDPSNRLPFDVAFVDPPVFGTGGSRSWTLTAPANAPAWQPGEALTVSFDVDSVLVDEVRFGFQPIRGWRGDKEQPILNLGLTALTASTNVPVAAVGTAPSTFVTITPAGFTSDSLIFELWFHPKPQGTKDDLHVLTPIVQAFDELNGNAVQVRSLVRDTTYANMWIVTVARPVLTGATAAGYVRFVFPLAGFTLTTTAGTTVTLASVIDQGIVFAGYERGAARIVAFGRNATIGVIGFAGPSQTSVATAAPAETPAPAPTSPPSTGAASGPSTNGGQAQ